jgi:hypothetical protein
LHLPTTKIAYGPLVRHCPNGDVEISPLARGRVNGQALGSSTYRGRECNIVVSRLRVTARDGASMAPGIEKNHIATALNDGRRNIRLPIHVH